MATKALSLAGGTFSSKQEQQQQMSQWVNWLKEYHIVARLMNFACQYKNMMAPVTQVLVVLLSFPPLPLPSNEDIEHTEHNAHNENNTARLPPVLAHLLNYLDYVLVAKIGVVDHLQLCHCLMSVNSCLDASCSYYSFG